MTVRSPPLRPQSPTLAPYGPKGVRWLSAPSKEISRLLTLSKATVEAKNAGPRR